MRINICIRFGKSANESFETIKTVVFDDKTIRRFKKLEWRKNN